MLRGSIAGFGIRFGVGFGWGCDVFGLLLTARQFFKIDVNQVKRKQKDKKLRVRYCANLFASKDKVIDRRLTIKSQAKSKKDSPV